MNIKIGQVYICDGMYIKITGILDSEVEVLYSNGNLAIIYMSDFEYDCRLAEFQHRKFKKPKRKVYNLVKTIYQAPSFWHEPNYFVIIAKTNYYAKIKYFDGTVDVYPKGFFKYCKPLSKEESDNLKVTLL